MRAFASIAFAATLGCALFASSEARAEEPPPPPVRYPPSSVRPRLIAGGLLITGIGYGAAILGSEAGPNWPGAQELKVPVIGPWWALGLNRCPERTDVNFLTGKPSVFREKCEGYEYLRAGLLILDGLVQAAGLAIVVEAITMKTEATASPKKSAMRFDLGSVTFHPTPLISPTVAGLGLTGTF